ncbi:MAG TPA: O-antigen ligase family protein [Solirubrobacteraceae bacterium]|nr:O-antigen ligase family protein [Solirubrobacteraceae bacterium]
MPDANVTPLFPRARAAGFPQRIAWVVAGTGALGWAAAVLSGGLYGESSWGALTLVVLGAIGLVSTTERPLPTGSAAIGLACVALLVILAAGSALWAQSVDVAWRETCRLTLYAGTIALCVLVGRTRSGRWILAAAITGGAAIVVVWVWTRIALGDADRAFIDGRLAYPLDYPNGLAFVFVVVALAACAWAPSLRRGIATAMVVLASLGLDLAVLTQSRAVIVALAAGAGGLMLAAGRRTRALALLCALLGTALALPATLEVYRSTPVVSGAAPAPGTVTTAVWVSLAGALAAGALWAFGAAVASRLTLGGRRRAAGVVAGLVVVALTAAALVATSFNPAGAARSALQRFENLDQSRSSTRFASQAGYRYDLWRVALDQAADHPLLGVGAGNYADTYTQRRRNPSYVRQPHSLPLQVVAELGVLGLVLLGGFAVTLCVAAAGARAPSAGAPAIVAATVCAAYAAHSSVDWLHNLPGITLGACAAAGLLLGGALQARPPRTVPRVALVLVLLACAGLGAVTGRHWAAERELESARAALASNPAQAARRAARAVALNPHSTGARYAQAAARAQLSDYTGARAALREALRLEPNYYVGYALLGDLETRAGNRRAAARAYAQARRRNPGGFTAAGR